MATLQTIINWFKTGNKPTEAQFTEAWSSFRHKEDTISSSDIEGLSNLMASKAERAALQLHIEDEELHGGGSEVVAEDISVILEAGENAGHFVSGDTFSITEGMTLNDFAKKMLQKLVPAVFNLPQANLEGNLMPSNDKEVGESLTIDFTASLSQNDGGPATSYVITKDGVEISNTATVTDTIVLTTENVSYQATIGYEAGTGTKPNSLGEEEPNTITAGLDNSNTLSYRGYRAVFYGATATKLTGATDIRALNKRLENSRNTFTLSTGTTHKIFQFWLPTGKNLVSVVDLDALNADITSSYGTESLDVNDAGGNPISGTLYTLTGDVPYGTSHRHEITIGS